MAVHVGELIVGRYELELLVGEGGMSTVYRAHDTVLERRVAIKVLHEHFGRDPEYVERFRREARAIARLAHPNVVTVIDRGEWEERQFIVFEHVDGENLKTVIERAGDLAGEVEGVSDRKRPDALAFAHQLGIVHRDVKPHNVLVDGSGTAKVTDFGIARALDADEALTATGTVLGTGQYLSPEQANGGRGDERSDQYSLGVVAYELLTGRPPYTGDSLMAVAMKHVRDPVPSVRDARPDVPERVDAVVAKAMAKDPRDRFGSMEALAAALESCLAEMRDHDAHREELTGIIKPQPQPRAEPAPDLTQAVSQPATATARTQAAPPKRSGLRVAGILLLAVVILVGNLLVLQLVFEDGLPGLGGGGDPTQVRVEAVADVDPEGDGTEHPESVSLATDRDVATFWPTESYRSFDKTGVGIAVDAGSLVALSRMVVITDTPGFTAQILGGATLDGEFVDVADEQEVGRRTTFDVNTRGEDFRYYVVWITSVSGSAHVNEVRAFVSR